MSNSIAETNNVKVTDIKSSAADKVKKRTAAYIPSANLDKDIKDCYVSSKKKRGLIAKFCDTVGKVFSLGISENKVLNKIKDFEEGKASKEETKKYIERYENANYNASEITIDTLATSAAIGIGFMANKVQTLSKVFTPKLQGKTRALGIAASVLGALAVKTGLKGIDSLGKDKEVRKNEKTALNNVVSGTFDGVAGALSAISPVLIPAGIAINAFTRYITDKKDDNTLPSISDFLEKQKDSIGVGILGVAGVTAAAAKGHIKVAEIKNSIKKVAENKAHVVTYRPPKGQLTEFQQLARDLGYDLSVIIKGEKFDPTGISKLDEDFLKILLEKGKNGDIEGKLRRIEQENIFLPKYLQTVIDIPEDKQAQLVRQIDELVTAQNARKAESSYNGRDFSFSMRNYAVDQVMEKLEEKGMDVEGFKDLQQIIKRIKSSCPTSRSIEDAQAMVNGEYGGEYTITKLLGVGSIAESYLATNKKGEEVVIKLVKQHFLDGDKIAADKAKVMKKVAERSKTDYSLFSSKQTIKTPERREYDENQLENMYRVWGNEINLSEEALSATQIGEQASKFSPVGVIDAKPSIFIMEKAKGVQMDSDKFAQKWQEQGLTEEDFKAFVENYVKVYCEQLFSLPKKGQKVVQSDPHGGNILVDIEQIKNLKNGAKPITIIDYGNTTKTEQAQAIKNLFNHIDYLIGNTDAIAEAMLEGAKLGKNNKAQMIKELSNALREAIYNPDTKIEVDNPVKIFSTVNSFCLEFMQKKNIIPNASHINQMKAEETYVISNLGCLKNVADACGYDIAKAVDREVIIKQLVNEMANATQDAIKINPTLTASEIGKRYSFFANNSEEALSCLGINFNIV